MKKIAQNSMAAKTDRQKILEALKLRQTLFRTDTLPNVMRLRGDAKAKIIKTA
jgi:hypothetical protein